MFIGCHLSVSQGLTAMGQDALSIGANTMQFFTRNPRGGAAKNWEEDDIRRFLQLLSDNQFGKLVAHAPYTMNLASGDPKIREFAEKAMGEDLAKMAKLPGNYYNFHPGSHVGQGVEAGIKLIAEALNRVLSPDCQTTVLLETMAGKGSEIGSTFQELRSIMDQTEHQELLGVCLDTCHVFDAGMDITNSLDQILDDFDKTLGLHKLKAIHLNDSIYGLASHKDRHAVIGGGKLGLDAIATVINHPLLKELPFELETPNELPGYAKEIALLKSLRKD